MGDKRIITHEPSITRIMHTDPHMPGRQVFQTIYHNDRALRRNEQIRKSGMMRRGDKMSVLGGATVSHAFSFPSQEEMALCQKKYPDIFAGLRSRDQSEREKAANRLEILHPEYVTISEK